MAQIRGVLLDIDGTLIDSNDATTHAWIEAMTANGYDIPFEKVRPLIGMGGDKVLPETLGVEKDSKEGEKVSARRKQIYKERYLPHVQPFPDAKALVQAIHDHGLTIATATSAEEDEASALLDIIGVSDLIDIQITSKDAKSSKPSPDVMEIALQRIGYTPDEVVMLGDTAYDIEAAKKVGISTIAFRCGGWKDADLAGAIAIYDDPADLLTHYEQSPLAKTSARR